ncbi:MAG: VIT domain-containing protein [Thermoplasmata archaeon]
MLNTKMYDNSRPDGFAVMEIVGGHDALAYGRLFVPLRNTYLMGEITGPFATLQVTHRYMFTKAQCDKVIEACYRFPLPGDAAVTGVKVKFGNTAINSLLKERTKAEEMYNRAKSEGRQASLLTRESPDIFSLNIAGIKPDEEVTVQTSFVVSAKTQGTGWVLRFPLTTAPRYVSTEEQKTRHASGQPLALLHDPGHRFDLALLVRDALSVTSLTHEIESRSAGREEGSQSRYDILITLRNGAVVPDRDFVISWEPVNHNKNPTFKMYLHKDVPEQATYFLAVASPPSSYESEKAVPREMLVLVDHSGSMEGPKWEAADWVVRKLLTDLKPTDTFNLGLFHDYTKWFSKDPLRATKGKIDSAIRFLLNNRDSGGTELYTAIESALRQPRLQGNSARHLLIITDAEVTDAARILQLVSKEFTHPERRRISVICIDAAPNSYLATEIADRGGGLCKFLTSSPEEEDISSALDEIIMDWTEPVLSGLKLEVNRKGVETAGQRAINIPGLDQTIVDIGDLPSGRTVWVAGRIPTIDLEDLNVRLIDGDGKEVSFYYPEPVLEVQPEGIRPSEPVAVYQKEKRANIEEKPKEEVREKGVFQVIKNLPFVTIFTGTPLIYQDKRRKDMTPPAFTPPPASPVPPPPASAPLSPRTVPAVQKKEEDDDGDESQFCPAVKVVFGSKRVLALEYLMNTNLSSEELQSQFFRTGLNWNEYLKLFSESKNQREALRRMLVQESLKFNIASSETAFIAIRKQIGEKVEKSVTIANAVPYGAKSYSESCVPSQGIIPLPPSYAPPSYAGQPAMPSQPLPPPAPPPCPPDIDDLCCQKSSPADYENPPEPEPVCSSDSVPAQYEAEESLPPGGGFSSGTSKQEMARYKSKAPSFKSPTPCEYEKDESPPLPMAAPCFAAPPFIQPAPSVSRSTFPPLLSIFSGKVDLAGPQFTLFDSARSEDLSKIPQHDITITGIVLKAQGANLNSIDRNAAIMLFVEDMSSPRATVKIQDILKLGGERPVNLRCPAGKQIKIVIFDTKKTIAGLTIELSIKWSY